MNDFSLYAGRWVALTESHHVVGVGSTCEEAQVIGRSRQPKEHLRLVWISPHPPHVAFPDWPLSVLRPFLDPERVWLAGGVVRDLLLNRPMHDWDFVVDGDAISLARHIADTLQVPFYPLDEQRDTGRALLPQPGSGKPVYLDFAKLRAPSLTEDLWLRDFTINAMALSLDGQLIDPTGGRRDLRQQLIRVTQPRSFDDDPLRLLRAVRQAESLGFSLAPATKELLQDKAALIVTVSHERVRMELRQILQFSPVRSGLEASQSLGLLSHTLPEIDVLRNVPQSAPHVYPNVWEHTMAALAAIEGITSLVKGSARGANSARPGTHRAWQALTAILHPWQPQLLAYLRTEMDGKISRGELLKWGTLYHDVGKAQTRTVDERGRTHFYTHEVIGAQLARQRLAQLRFPTKAQDFVDTLVREHMSLLTYRRQRPTRRAIYRFYRRCGDAGVGVVLLALADTLAVFGKTLSMTKWEMLLRSADDFMQAYFAQHAQIVAPRPLLSGKDVLALGIPQGPQVGFWLERLREMQAEGQLATREEALAWLESQLANEQS